MSAELVLELLAKSGVIAGAGLGLSALLGARPAADRVDVLRAAVCVLLALPLTMALAPALQIPLLPATAGAPFPAPSPVWQGTVTPVDGLSLSSSVRPPSPMEMVVGLWMLGALVVFGRFVLGVLTLWRWTGSGAAVTDDAWTAPLARLVPGRRPRLVVSSRVAAPLSWGLPPGVVLIGKACLARPENAAAVMAHELAHIRRGDWLFLGLSRLALALFWFNPLVWLLHATLASRTEDAADAAALAAVDRRTYARALVGLAADFRPSAAIGMAGDAQSLTRRITRIMNPKSTSRRHPLGLALAVGALIAVATPIAAVELTQQAPPPPVPPSPPTVVAIAPPAPPAPPALPTWGAIAAPAPPAPPMVMAISGSSPFGAPPAPPAPPAHPAHPAPPAPARHGATSSQERAEARRHAEAARAHAAQAHAAPAAEARERARRIEAEAAQVRVNARAMQEQAAREIATARVQMRLGADQMVEGANQMRQESQNLRDPAYRARQIERARERGDRVPTDAELEALAPRLATQAEELEQQAVRLRQQAAEPS